ncbi:MAG: hypothetical protein ACOX3K_00850 [Bacilli bacterium]
MLPPLKKIDELVWLTPKKFQIVILRNFGYVANDVLADILDTDEKTIINEAKRLGLGKVRYNENFIHQGYITLIRNNWFLLPYAQIAKLIGKSLDELEVLLLEEDFLSVKLGNFKPDVKDVTYTPLNVEEINRTNQIKEELEHYDLDDGPLFDFSLLPNRSFERNNNHHKRIIYPYSVPAGDIFLFDSQEYLTDEYLTAYKQENINGIWLTGILSKLALNPLDPLLSVDYLLRRNNLRNLVERCRKFDIGVYLYFNELRAINIEKVPSERRGTIINQQASLCLENAENQKMIYDMFKDLFDDIAFDGVITITMSENLTHCQSLKEINCPRCLDKAKYTSAVKINNLISKAAKDSKNQPEVIANLWGWSSFMNWERKDVFKGIKKLNRDISIMCVSEYDKEIDVLGFKNRVIDYSISHPGPSEISEEMLTFAQKKGHKVYAKIQINNSWECSAVPYIPCFSLIHEHLNNLQAIGVNDYMLSWTLGGFPSRALSLAALKHEAFNFDEWCKKVFNSDNKRIPLAFHLVSEAFAHYPFSLNSIYFSPTTLGPANYLSLNKTNLESSMVCYSFDDYEKWTNPYPSEIYLEELNKVCQGFHDALDILDNIRTNDTLEEAKRYLSAAYIHLKSNDLITRFSVSKAKGGDLVTPLKGLYKLLQRLLILTKEDGKIGFEASNQYYYTRRLLIERAIAIKNMLKRLDN